MPWDFYRMLPRHFYAMCEGHIQERHRLMEHDRIMTYFNIAPHTKQGFTYGQFMTHWQMPYDVIKEVPKLTGKQMAATLDLHNKRITLQQYREICPT